MTALSFIVYILQGHPLKLCLTGIWVCIYRSSKQQLLLAHEHVFLQYLKNSNVGNLRGSSIPKWHQREQLHMK